MRAGRLASTSKVRSAGVDGEHGRRREAARPRRAREGPWRGRRARRRRATPTPRAPRSGGTGSRPSRRTAGRPAKKRPRASRSGGAASANSMKTSDRRVSMPTKATPTVAHRTKRPALRQPPAVERPQAAQEIRPVERPGEEARGHVVRSAPGASGRHGHGLEDLAHDVLLGDAGVAGLRLEAEAVGEDGHGLRLHVLGHRERRGPRGSRGPGWSGRASGCRGESSRDARTGAAAWPRPARRRSGPSERSTRTCRTSAWRATTSSPESTGSTASSGWRSAWRRARPPPAPPPGTRARCARRSGRAGPRAAGTSRGTPRGSASRGPGRARAGAA